MTEWTKFDWFLFGAAIGIFVPFASTALTKIIHEAKIAKQEWRNPPSPSKRNRDEHAP
jgi:hypothetical protein